LVIVSLALQYILISIATRCPRRILCAQLTRDLLAIVKSFVSDLF